MNIKYSVSLAISIFLFSGVSVSGQGFDTFSTESLKAEKELNCEDTGTTPASYGMGALYGCIQGEAQTVKWFINEIPNTNRVENVKLMWNDWFKDRGHGVHTDINEAKYALWVLIDMYAPDKREELENVFWGEQDKTIRVANYILKYTYSRGPAIDERLIVVTER